MFNDFVQELRQALRATLRRPGHAALVVVIIAVVMGAGTGILAVVDSVLLRALPYPDAERLVIVWDTNAERGIPEMNLSVPKVEDLRDQVASFDRIGAALTGTSLILTGRQEPQRLTGTLASPELLELTGVVPALGRVFAPQPSPVPGEPREVLLSHELWQREFGGSDEVLGRDVTLSGASYTIVGVMPPDFVDFPFPAQQTDLWIPTTMADEIYGVEILDTRTARWVVALARLRRDATRDDALAELALLDDNLAAAYPDAEAGWAVRLEPLRELFLGDLQPPLVGLAAGSVLLLVIGCANVTSLLLVHASSRQVELATRRALGASRLRLARRALTEALLLVLTGGALGTITAAVGLESLAARVPVDWPRYIRIGADSTVFALAAVMMVGAAVIAGLLSIVPTLRSGASGALPSTGRVVEPSGGALRRGLVIAEVAVAVTLLVGAGLTLHSFVRLRGADLGFSTDDLLAMRIEAPVDAFSAERLGVLAAEIERRVEGVGGVDDAFIWSPQVPGQSAWYTAIRPRDRPELGDNELPLVRFHYVGPGALEGLGLRFVAGRGIGPRDTAEGAGAIVVSESAARALWPEGDDPLGKVVRRWNRDRWLTVVGVTEDAKHSGRRGPGTEENLDVYFAFRQEPQNEIVVLARAEAGAGQTLDGVRRAVRGAAPGLPAFDADTMAARLGEQEAIPRFTALLATVFAGTALFLASIGLYGVLAYTVCLRTREIGVRVALGARPGRVLREVVGGGMRLACLGVTLGLLGALGLTRWLEELLFEVSPNDPVTFAGAAAVLLVVAASAALVPALRALRVDPQEALRTG